MFLGSPLGGPPLNNDKDQPLESNQFTIVSPTGSNKQVVPDSEDEDYPDLLGGQVNQNESLTIPDNDANDEEEGEQEIEEPIDEEAGEDEQEENIVVDHEQGEEEMIEVMEEGEEE